MENKRHSHFEDNNNMFNIGSFFDKIIIGKNKSESKARDVPNYL